MNTVITPATDISVGDQIVLDMGYGAHSMDEVCEVNEVKHGQSLFETPVIRFKVRRPGGQIIDVVDHSPKDFCYKVLP